MKLTGLRPFAERHFAEKIFLLYFRRFLPPFGQALFLDAAYN
jgi:hypothetical protein